MNKNLRELSPGRSVRFAARRIRDVRVFYDVTEQTVEVLAIVRKAEADGWLREKGELQ